MCKPFGGLSSCSFSIGPIDFMGPAFLDNLTVLRPDLKFNESLNCLWFEITLAKIWES